MHLKRNKTSKCWPIPRKGTKFLVVPSHNHTNSIPLLIVLRDILKVTKTRAEAKQIISGKKVSVNGKTARDEKLALGVFDILSLDGKDYKIVLKNKKFALEETKSKEKIAKVIGKRILRDNVVQINLKDGRNFLSKEKISVGDSVAVKDGKVEKVIKMKEGGKVYIMKGKHLGKEGKIEKMEEKTALVIIDKEKVNLAKENLVAI